MDLQPVLEGDLVEIRPMVEADMEPLYEVAKDPLIWEQHHAKRYLRSQFVTYFQESMKSGGALTILDKKVDQVIGSSRFKRVDGLSDVLEIGWTFLGRAYWGGRFNREVKHLMINHAFKYVDKIIFLVHRKNHRSQRAIENINGKKADSVELSFLSNVNPDYLIYLLHKQK